MKRPYGVVATGGTFDHIHVGHLALLSRAFELGETVIIGISSDEFALRRGKKLSNKFDVRKAALERAIHERFGDVNCRILKLEGDFGPQVKNERVDALIASHETSSKGEKLNELRRLNGLPPVEIISIELLRAQDGKPISSTRIRAGEIDNEGRLLSKTDER